MRKKPDHIDLDKMSRVELTFNWYQANSNSTAVYADSAMRIAKRLGRPAKQDELARLLRQMQVAMGAADEAGECLGKVKKLLRDHDGVVTPEFIMALGFEIGDVLYYIARLCAEFGMSMAKVALMNAMKLKGRALRGTLGGSGDVR